MPWTPLNNPWFITYLLGRKSRGVAFLGGLFELPRALNRSIIARRHVRARVHRVAKKQRGTIDDREPEMPAESTVATIRRSAFRVWPGGCRTVAVDGPSNQTHVFRPANSLPHACIVHGDFFSGCPTLDWRAAGQGRPLATHGRWLGTVRSLVDGSSCEGRASHAASCANGCGPGAPCRWPVARTPEWKIAEALKPTRRHPVGSDGLCGRSPVAASRHTGPLKTVGLGGTVAANILWVSMLGR